MGAGIVDLRCDRRVAVDFALRTQHIDYLQLVADRWESPVSEVFRTLIERKIADAIEPQCKPPKQVRKHLTLGAKHLQYIDGVAARTGLSRSDVARRLINEFLDRDGSVQEPKPSSVFMKLGEA